MVCSSTTRANCNHVHQYVQVLILYTKQRLAKNITSRISYFQNQKKSCMPIQGLNLNPFLRQTTSNQKKRDQIKLCYCYDIFLHRMHHDHHTQHLNYLSKTYGLCYCLFIYFLQLKLLVKYFVSKKVTKLFDFSHVSIMSRIHCFV